VDILSPNDTVMDLTETLREYFAIDVTLVWVPTPGRAECIYVPEPHRRARVPGNRQALQGGCSSRPRSSRSDAAKQLGAEAARLT
jgi:hypothetical protein